MKSNLAWQQLSKHYDQVADIQLKELFADDSSRFETFSLEAAGLFLDYSKHHITMETMEQLCQLASSVNLHEKIEQLFSGFPVNFTEDKPALHTKLRALEPEPGCQFSAEVASLQHKMQVLAEKIHTGDFCGHTGRPFTDVVNIGIGGSDLGPLMVTEALKPYRASSLNLHFVANVDATHIAETLKPLNPETTLFIIASKSFRTAETLLNAKTAKVWLNQQLNSAQAFKSHMLGISVNKQAVLDFGIPDKNYLAMSDGVGGRYSVWSVIGLPIVLMIGMDNFRQFLAGARAMDEHFKLAPFSQNLPVIMALIGVWYSNFFNVKSHLILPYDQYLKHFPAYIQQLEMESNGKRIDCNHQQVEYATSPIIWGQTGCIGQHSFHQFLYQGTQMTSADFICPVLSHNPIGDHHQMLFANCISQARALMCGKTHELARRELMEQGFSDIEADQLASHKSVAGNRPSNMILFERLCPKTLGALIALYEHKVFVQGCIWGINSFDQWGVELGKEITQELFLNLSEPERPLEYDSSTNGLIHYFKQESGIRSQDSGDMSLRDGILKKC